MIVVPKLFYQDSLYRTICIDKFPDLKFFIKKIYYDLTTWDKNCKHKWYCNTGCGYYFEYGDNYGWGTGNLCYYELRLMELNFKII